MAHMPLGGGGVPVPGFPLWAEKRGTWQGGQGWTGPASAIYGGVRGRGVPRVGAGGRAQQGSWWRGRVGIDKDRTRPPSARNSASKRKGGRGRQEGQGLEPGGHQGPACKMWGKKGARGVVVTSRAGSHCFNLAFSQVVNTACRVGPGIRRRWVAGLSVQAAAVPTWPRLTYGNEPIPQGR
jgi:hypothetical protein